MNKDKDFEFIKRLLDEKIIAIKKCNTFLNKLYHAGMIFVVFICYMTVGLIIAQHDYSFYKIITMILCVLIGGKMTSKWCVNSDILLTYDKQVGKTIDKHIEEKENHIDKMPK